MELRKNRAEAEHELMTLISRGYEIAEWVVRDNSSKRDAGTYEVDSDWGAYIKAAENWATDVESALAGIFPGGKEVNCFRLLLRQGGVGLAETPRRAGRLKDRLLDLLMALEKIREKDLPQYDEPYETASPERGTASGSPNGRANSGSTALGARGETEDSKAKVDLLVVTTTKVESHAVMQVFQQASGNEPNPERVGDRIYHDLGEVNGARVFMALTEMGSGGLNASLQAVEKGIDALSPADVIMVGIAFGVNEKKQAIGDVLVSQQLWLYDLQRVGADRIIDRGDKPHASPRLIDYLRSADLHADDFTVRFGLILTGEKLVDNVDYREQLKQFEPEVIGGEMESAGLYAACHDRKVDWIVVKAICDWADGKKVRNKKRRQSLAATNAACFVLHALQHAPLRQSPGAGGRRVRADQGASGALPNAGQRSDGGAGSPPLPAGATGRGELFECLKGTPPGQLAQLIFTLHPPAGVIRGSSAPQAERVEDLVGWAEGPGGCGLEVLARELDRVLGRPR